MKKTKRKKYQGLGFVELLISLAVAAIAVMVLMNMTTNSMREAIRYERHDALTRLAMDGALIVRRHVERANANDPKNPVSFNPSTKTCYKILLEESEGTKVGMVDFDEGLFSYDSFSNYHNELIGDEAFHTDIVYDEAPDFGDKYYLAYCVDFGEDNIYIGKIVTGFVDCKNCGIEPYEQPIIVSIN